MGVERPEIDTNESADTTVKRTKKKYKKSVTCDFGGKRSVTCDFGGKINMFRDIFLKEHGKMSDKKDGGRIVDG